MNKFIKLLLLFGLSILGFLTVEREPVMFLISQFFLLFTIISSTSSSLSALININLAFIPWSWYNIIETGFRFNIYTISTLLILVVLLFNIDINKNYSNKFVKLIFYLFSISIISFSLSLFFSNNLGYSFKTILSLLPCFFPFLYFLSNFSDNNFNKQIIYDIGLIQPIIGITVSISMLMQTFGLIEAGRTWIRVGRFSVSSLFFDFTTVCSYFLFVLLTTSLFSTIKKSESITYKFIVFFTVFFTIIGLILSGSKAGFLALGGAFTYYLLFNLLKISIEKIVYLLISSISFTSIFLIINNIRTDTLGFFYDDVRIENWLSWLSYYFDSTLNNIIFGFGPGYQYFFDHAIYFSPHNLLVDSLLIGGIIFLTFVSLQIFAVYFSNISTLTKSLFTGFLLITMVAPSVFETRVLAATGFVLSILLSCHLNKDKLLNE